MHILRFVSFILLLRTCNANKNIVPVLLLDYVGSMRHTDYEPNPFRRMSEDSFRDIIHSAIKRSEGIVVFVENTLSIEDLTRKDRLGTAFYHLRQGLLENQVKYFPNVINPYGILNEILEQIRFNVFRLNLGTKLELTDDFKNIYVYFKNGVNETRVKMLRRHDMIISEVCYAVRKLKKGSVIAFYTGKMNPVVVETTRFTAIKVKPIPKELDVVVLSEGAIFRFSGIFAATMTRRATYSQMPVVAEETWSKWKLSTRLSYTDFELQFNFDLEDISMWTLESVSLIEGGEEVGRTMVYASAPWDCSFVCREPIVLINARDGSSVTIPKYQIQPFRPITVNFGASSNATSINGTSGNNTSFGTPVNCGPYFNTHILSGLVVTAVFLGILTYGLISLFNCSTNSKFDDPSGRPLMSIPK